MALFVIDEWLWHDVSKQNGDARQKETIRFVFAVFDICDRFVIVEGSKFQQKSMAIWKSTDPMCRNFSRFFKDSFLYNSLKVLKVSESELPSLREEMKCDTNADDHYLLRAHFGTDGSKIVTTDTRLKPILEKHGIANEYRNEFVTRYLEDYQRIRAAK